MKASVAAIAVFGIAFAAARPAAGQRPRHEFEPTDLRLQPAGTVELDLQGGLVTGEDGRRVFAPDFETSIGIADHAQLEIDGTFGLDEDSRAVALDNTLVGLRLGILDLHDSPTSTSAWSAGIQAGPRLPTYPGARGLGFEALAIGGRSAGRLHLYGQIGALVDCLQSSPGVAAYRPTSLESGIDLDLDLDDHDEWSLKGELGYVKYFSIDRDQLHATAGPAVRVAPWLEVSVVGVVGFLAGGDRAGVLLGATTRFKAF